MRGWRQRHVGRPTVSALLLDEKWEDELGSAVRADCSALRIICPFIKPGALQKILDQNQRNIQVITRFNLVDIAAGVSDVAAL